MLLDRVIRKPSSYIHTNVQYQNASDRKNPFISYIWNMNWIQLIYLTTASQCLCMIPQTPWNDTFIYDYLGSYYYYLTVAVEVVWFLSQHLDAEQYERTSNLITGIANFRIYSQFIWTNETNVRMMKIDSKRHCLGMVITTGAKDPVMISHNRVMTGRHYTASIIVYAGKVTDMKPIEELCWLLYRENFVHGVVIFQTDKGHNQVFGVREYPRYKMRNRTNYLEAFQEELTKITAASQDVQGYKFYTPLRQDLPGLFKFLDKLGQERIQGTTYRILLSFVDSRNGSIVDLSSSSSSWEDVVDMNEILELVRLKKIDLSAHAYALFRTDDDLDKSYPIMVVKWCLMVPLHNSISTLLYALQPFEWTVWFLVISVLLSLCIMDFLRFIIYSHQGRNNIWLQLSLAWLNNFCHILNLSPAHPVFITSYKRFLYYASIFLFGFFLTAFYSSYLGSILTLNLFRAQINTMEDLINARLRIMIIDYELEFLLSKDNILPDDFLQLVYPVNSSSFYKHQIAFNSSFAYFITDDKWHFLDETQKHLKEKLFKFTDICFGSYHLAYPMQKDSPIWRDLEYFLYRIHSSGLFHMYESKALQYALSGGNIQRFAETNEYSSVGLDHLLVMFMLLGFMFLISTICLIMEIFVYHR